MFRVKLHHVAGADLKANAQMGSFYFVGNFDNFRSFKSPRQDHGSPATAPMWDNWEILFVYETELHHMLLAKLFTLQLYCALDGDTSNRDHFFGEASCDLLHLALGPSQVVLSLHNGDVEVGDVIFTCEMEEVAETKVNLRSFEINFVPHFDADVTTCDFIIETKCHQPMSVNVGKPRNNRGPGCGIWTDVGLHYMGTTAVELLQDAGLRFELRSSGIRSKVVARGSVSFGFHMPSNARRLTLDPGNPDSAKIEDVSHDVTFDNLPLTDEDGGKNVGHITGLVELQNVPFFAQMYAGTNIDGCVYEGRRYNEYLPIPPNVAPDDGELSSQRA